MLKAYLFIGETKEKGRGVFTRERIPAHVTIEIAPVIVMENSDREHLDKTLLHDYIFEWGTDQKSCCMALGWVPIYNHSYNSNCDYLMDYEDLTISIKTEKVIEKGEELTINYNGDPNDGTKIWFDAK